MGKGISARLATAAAFAALAGCTPEPQQGATNAAEAATPVAEASSRPLPSASAPLREWLVGSWSFEASCATDFVVHFGADGTLDNGGEIGSWSLEGDRVTENIRERFENGGEALTKVDPPLTRSYTIERTDATHGTITFEGRKVAMLRC